MVLIGAIRYMFLSKAVKNAFKSGLLRSPYEGSINAFRSDVDAGNRIVKTAKGHDSRGTGNIRVNSKIGDNVSSQDPSDGQKSGSKVSKTELSEILADADKRSAAIVITPKREKLIEMMRLLHRKQQRVFDGLSPTRRRTLRMIAEHMLGVEPDDNKKH